MSDRLVGYIMRLNASCHLEGQRLGEQHWTGDGIAGIAVNWLYIDSSAVSALR